MQRLFVRSREQSIRMRKMMKKPSIQKKVELKETYEIQIQKFWSGSETSKRYGKKEILSQVNDMEFINAKVNQVVKLFQMKSGKIAKIAKKLLPKVKIQTRKIVKRAREVGNQ